MSNINENKKILHKKMFDKTINYNPLFVNVKSNPRPYTNYEEMRDPQKAIDNAVIKYKNSLKVESDLVTPYVDNNFLECLIPSLFGAKTYESAGGFIDVKPIFNSIYETKNIAVNDIFTGEMENAINHITYLMQNKPDFMDISPSRPMSPLDYAVVLRGGDFYMDIALEPELSTEFMNTIADVTIKVTKELKSIINQPLNQCIAPRGCNFPGIRITGDAVVNLSPKMIENIICPLYKKFQNVFGGVMLHYCTLPSPSTHVLPALIRGGGVDCVDNWQGYKTLLAKEDYTQSTIGICTDVAAEQIENHSIFTEEFFNVHNRPLLTSVNVDTVKQGEKIYDIWQKHMN